MPEYSGNKEIERAMRAADAEQWIAAMNEEKEAFFANGTWEIVDADPAWNLLSSK